MVELLVAMTLLSLIVLVLMAVFSSTQRAFRASMTQTDVLEGSRFAMDLITTDLRTMVPSYGVSNYVYLNGVYSYGAVNFFNTNNAYEYPQYGYAPLVQSLPGTGAFRTNTLQCFFILGRKNTKWTGAGYAVNSGSSSPLYPLYRFYAETNIDVNPLALCLRFQYEVYNGQWTNLSHVMDGVVHLVVRTYDPNGYWLTNGYDFWQTNRPQNVWFSPVSSGEVGCAFYSNAVPAAVELQLGVLEDRTLQRASSLGAGVPRSAYLQNQAGHVQLFRARVSIPNVDPTAYQ
jgi:hypothetical protein